MPLTKAVGNMYSFVTHTKNYIRGKCPIGCEYCYVPHTRAKRFYEGEPRLIEKELHENLGTDKFIFVGSMFDMWHNSIPNDWIDKILRHCKDHRDNKYLFQSKNPERFACFNVDGDYPLSTIFGTTLESNRVKGFTERCMALAQLRYGPSEPRVMISIEPIMRFDLDELVGPIQYLSPSFVTIGADSKGHEMLVPTKHDLKCLIAKLATFTRVIQKDNLRRLL